MSKKKKESMLEALELASLKTTEPEFDPVLAKSIHKLDDFAPSPTRYVRQQRIKLVLSKGGKNFFKKDLTSYQLIEHRDQYDTRDPEERKILVESDKTTTIIIAHSIDQKNLIGRAMRKAGATPIASIKETLLSALALLDEEEA